MTALCVDEVFLGGLGKSSINTFENKLTLTCPSILRMASAAEMAAAMTQMDLSTIPLAVNPSGAPPNFVNPDSLANTVFGVGLALSLLSTHFVSLRLYTNWTNARRLALSDCMYKLTLISECN